MRHSLFVTLAVGLLMGCGEEEKTLGPDPCNISGTWGIDLVIDGSPVQCGDGFKMPAVMYANILGVTISDDANNERYAVTPEGKARAVYFKYEQVVDNYKSLMDPESETTGIARIGCELPSFDGSTSLRMTPIPTGTIEDIAVKVHVHSMEFRNGMNLTNLEFSGECHASENWHHAEKVSL